MKSKIKRYQWVPVAFFCVGVAFYVYYGITWNAWKYNLPNLLGYAVICILLWWALRKKNQLEEKRKNGEW